MASFADIQLEQEVLVGLQQGSNHALQLAYPNLSPAVMGMAFRILRDRGLAEEVVQDTFVQLMERGHTIEDPNAVVGWVRKVAVNQCLMRLRSPWHRRRQALDADIMDIADDSTAAAQSLGDMEKAMAKLSSSARLVVWLHDVEGYTHQEIGRLFGKTTSFSKSQLARAYEKLLKIYSGDQDESKSTGFRPSRTP